jgi:hypothetical protein
MEPAGPRLGRHASARVTRRGRLWRPQQHSLEAPRSIHDQCPVCRLPGHFRLPCSGGMAAGQRHPGSHHLDRPFPSHAQAPARNSSAGLRLHGAGCCKPARTAISCGLQLGRKRRGATSTSVRSSPRRQFGHPCPSELNLLHEAYKRRQDALLVSSTSQDLHPTVSGPIPSQRCLTQQLIAHWPQFKALRQRYAGTLFEEQLMLHLPQKHKATVPDSTLRVEMKALEEQADITKAC